MVGFVHLGLLDLSVSERTGDAALEISVRAYLDARMAEVTGCRQSRRLLPRYPYPNSRGFARDEKWQQDALLGEWLSRCLADGRALAPDLAAGGAAA